MASILKVNTIQDTDGNNIINENANVITIGASGDTITVPAGATVSGFTSAGIDDNATSTAITINSSEQVGIGKTSPASLLDVEGTSVVATFKSTNNNAVLRLKGNNATNGGALGSTSSGDLIFVENLSEGMRLTSTGLGIGTSSPDVPLDVEIDVGSSGTVARISNSNSTYSQDIDFKFNSNKDVILDTGSGSGGIVLEPGSRGVIINEEGGDKDFRVESDTDANAIYMDGTDGRVKIGSGAGTGGTGKFNVSANGFSTSHSNAHIVMTNGNNTTGDKALIMGEVTSSGGVRYRPVAFGIENTQVTLREGAFVVYVSDNQNVDLSTDERFRITNDGNVGIGDAAPLGKLHVKSADSGASVNSGHNQVIAENSGNSGMTILSGTSSNGAICFGDSGNNCIGYINYGHDGNHLDFGVNNSEAMRIDSSGLVGIGTSSPGSPLTVSGGTNSTVANLNNNVSATTSMSNVLLLQSNCSGSAGVGFGVNLAFNGERNDGNTQRFGNFGFSANTNSGASLKTDCVISLYSGHEVLRLKQNTVNGSDSEMIAPDLLTTGTTSNRYPLYWVHNGTIGSIQPYTGSVREMKTDINDMSSVDWIYSLKPRSFKFRDFETNEDGSKTYLETTNNEPSTEYGLIAEEVNEVSGSDYILDKQIDEDGNENLKGVLYHNLVPVLLKAVQEQKNTIQELEARITTLEANNP